MPERSKSACNYLYSEYFETFFSIFYSPAFRESFIELNPAEEPDDDTDRERRCGAYAVSQNYHPTLVFDTTLPESAIAALLEQLRVKWTTEDHYVSDSGEVSQNLVLTKYYSTADVRPMAPNWKKAN